MNRWVTIFDVANEPFRWGNAGEGLLAVAVVALGVAVSIALSRRDRRGGTAVLALAAGVAVFFAVRTLDHRRSHLECVETLRNGEGRVLEGTVEKYQPLESMWHRPWCESFVLNGVTIRYPLLARGCGYNQTAIEGGPIRSGLRVRVTEWKGEILRLELDRDAAGTRPHRHPSL